MKYGDLIRAKPNTVDYLFSEGKTGIIKEVRSNEPYSFNDSRNLVIWGNKSILMGFNPNDCEIVDETETT